MLKQPIEDWIKEAIKCLEASMTYSNSTKKIVFMLTAQKSLDEAIKILKNDSMAT